MGKRKFSEEALRNIRKAAAKRKGIKTGPCSEERKRAISEAKKGTGKSEEHKRKIRDSLLGVKRPEHSKRMKKLHADGLLKNPWEGKSEEEKKEIIKKTADKNRGRKNTVEQIEKRRQSLLKNWSEKPSAETRRGRKYREWRKNVLEKCDHKCQQCGSSENLHCHHIESWEKSVERRFEITNGTVYCASCHLKNDGFKKGTASWNKGKKLSEEHKMKLSKAKEGHIPWNKGRRKS